MMDYMNLSEKCQSFILKVLLGVFLLLVDQLFMA